MSFYTLNQEGSSRGESSFQELSQTTLFGRAVGYISDGSIGGCRWVLSSVEPEGDTDGEALKMKLNEMFPTGGPIRRTSARAELDFQHAVEDAVAAMQASNQN